MRKAYQSDLSDDEWSSLEPHLTTPEATGPTSPQRRARDPRRHLPRAQEPLRLATPATRVRTALEDLDPYPDESSWIVAGRGYTPDLRQRLRVRPPRAIQNQRRHCGLPVDHDDRGRKESNRGTTEPKRSKDASAFARRHARIGAQSAGRERGNPGPRKSSNSSRALIARSPPAPLTRVAGCRIHRPRQGPGWVRKVFGWTAEIVRHPPKILRRG